MTTETTVQRLRSQLTEIQHQLQEFIAQAQVRWFDRHVGGFVLTGPDYYFDKPTPDQVRRQSAIKTAYLDWFERLSLLFRSAPNDLEKRLKDGDDRVRKWIELGTNHSIGPDLQLNSRRVADDLREFFEILSLRDGPGRLLLLPDTNAVVAVADIRRFLKLSGSNVLELVLLPTVLSELDNLKIFARDQQFRDKVAKTVRRIKGWRKQGSLHAGITLYGGITVRAIAREPRMAESLSWLDSENRDDRILASALEVQASEPACQVVLVTGDLNLQNKAEAAHLPFAETP